MIDVNEREKYKEHKFKGEDTCGERIREIRKELNLKQKEFAEKLNISVPSLSEIETGKYRPGFDFLVNISKELNVNLYYVLFGEGNMFIDPVTSSYTHVGNYAVNVDDVRDFLYNFERSPILQYFIMDQYKTRMQTGKDIIMRDIEENKTKVRRPKKG